MASEVFFTDMQASPSENQLSKLLKLIKKAGIDKIDFKNKFTAIKIHFGEHGNMAYLRPTYAGTVVDFVKEKGGIPFITDANTLYNGMRSDAIHHIECAARNGYTRESIGCPVIIADGLKGIDTREVEINQKHCKTAKIASAIYESDAMVVISHFKGHGMAGFGGAVKNLAMGCASRGGKLHMHSNVKPSVKTDTCVKCAACMKNCPAKAIFANDNKMIEIDQQKCVGCGECIAMCRYDSIDFGYNEAFDVMNEKMAEYAYAATKDKPCFYINLIIDVSPECDCWNFNRSPICPNIGFLASFDPVALDKACVDLVNRATPSTESDACHCKAGEDKFHAMHPNAHWEKCLEHAVAIGLGGLEYKLVKV